MLTVPIIEDGKLFDGRYKLLRQLSNEGGTADVWLAEDKETEDEELSDDAECDLIKVDGSAVLVAIKIYRPKNILDGDGILTFKKEYKTVYNCHHANLLKPTGFSIIDDSIPYLVMPFCEKGSTEKLVGKMNDGKELWKFIFDTASGLAYLHSCNPPIIHQDIKPGNILIDDNGNYCITDFGISVKTDGEKGNAYDNGTGTIRYMPPERFLADQKPIPPSDVWSLGVTIYELVTGEVPFGEKGGETQDCSGKLLEIKEKIPTEIKKLINACLEYDPKKRPTAEAIAEMARTKGKKRTLLYASMLLIPMMATASALVWYNATPQQEDPFVSLCNRADSVINIEKNDAIMDEPVEGTLSLKRLSEAEAFYEDALKLVADGTSRKDSIEERIKKIKVLTLMFGEYENVSNSLKMARDDEADIAIRNHEKSRDSISNMIKNKIINL